MSEFENPELSAASHVVTVDDVRALTYGATPHFSLQLRNRLRRLIEPLAADDPARQLAELEIERLEQLAVAGRHGPKPSRLARLD
jgi:hypothetical protein